ncbi:MAK10-like protein [Tanacetum coccineum]
MASQDARLSKFEADFKQQQSKMTNKIDTVLKAITDRITGALPSDTVKNPKLNVNFTSPFCLLHSYQRRPPKAHQTPLIRSMLSKHVPRKQTILKKTRTESYPVGIVRDVEVHMGKLKFLNDFYVIDMEKDPTTPLLVGRGFLATANVVIDYRKYKIAIEERITRKEFMNWRLPREWEIARDVELNPFKCFLVFSKMVEFLGALPINLKGNMWESEDLIENPINWDKPPKNRDGAWHAKIRLIDPDGEEFTKTFQSIPTSRKLSKKENPRKIINLDHFHDT